MSARTSLAPLLLAGLTALPAGPAHAQWSGPVETRALSIVTIGDADSDAPAAPADPVRERARPGAFTRDTAREGDARPTPDEPAIAATLRALGPGFTRTETTNFVILSDAPQEWTRSRASLLERARHQFYRAAGRLYLRPTPHVRKLLCVLINDHARFREFGRAHDGLDAGWVAGYYSAQNNRIVFYNDAVSPEYEHVWSQLAEYDHQVRDARRRAQEARNAGREDVASRLGAAADDLSDRVARERGRLRRQAEDFSTAKTIHEAVHLLAFNTGIQRRAGDYPFWLSEGLAASFETGDPASAFGPDRDGSASRRARYRELVDSGAAPALGDIVTLSRTMLLEADAADAMYALSATLFQHLYRHDTVSLSLYMRALNDLGGRRLTPQQHRDLFVRHFGDPASLDRALRRALP